MIERIEKELILGSYSFQVNSELCFEKLLRKFDPFYKTIGVNSNDLIYDDELQKHNLKVIVNKKENRCQKAGSTIKRTSLPKSRAICGISSISCGELTAVCKGELTVGAATVSPHSVESLLRFAAATSIPLHSGLMVHASGIAYESNAFLFPGVSGAGKSTIAGSMPENMIMGDEITGITVGETLSAWSTPFSGSLEFVPEYKCLPLKALLYPDRAFTEGLSPISREESFFRLMKCIVSFGPWNNELLFSLAAKIAEAIPAFVIHADMKIDGYVKDILAKIVNGQSKN